MLLLHTRTRRPLDFPVAAVAQRTFNTLATHDLVLAIPRGAIKDTHDAAASFARNPAAPPQADTGAGPPIY